MNRLSKLIVMELIGPWCFGVGMFTVLTFAGNYLFKISDYFAQGAAPFQVIQMALLILPGIIVKTFAMAVLLAGLLAFGRLSSDSEIVALKASGISVGRMMRPVAGFSLVVAVITFLLNELIVPDTAMRALELQRDIAVSIKESSDRPLSFVQQEDGKTTALVGARSFNIGARTLRGVTITAYDNKGWPSFFLYVPELQYTDETNWRTVGGGYLVSAQSRISVRLIGDAWPPQVPKLTADPVDLLRQDLNALDALSIKDLMEQIEEARTDPHTSPRQLGNLEFGLWNKFALPLVALVYGLLGAPLGIRNIRTSTTSGFALSVAIIFAYITLANLMNVYAKGGHLPSYAASFTPVVIGLIAAGAIIHRRNR